MLKMRKAVRQMRRHGRSAVVRGLLLECHNNVMIARAVYGWHSAKSVIVGISGYGDWEGIIKHRQHCRKFLRQCGDYRELTFLPITTHRSSSVDSTLGHL